MPKTYDSPVIRATGESVLATNSVIRNTYILLSLSLLFSAAMAGVAWYLSVPPMGFVAILPAFVLLFAIQALRNSAFALLLVFAFTGWMGFTLGPVLSSVASGFSNGPQIIMTALGGTGTIFLVLSGYALTTRKNFNYLTGFVMCLGAILMLGVLAGLFIQLPAFHLAMSCGFMLFASAMILWETSQIIHGGQRNYILATVGLYLAIYNLFVSLLHILTALGGRD